MIGEEVAQPSWVRKVLARRPRVDNRDWIEIVKFNTRRLIALLTASFAASTLVVLSGQVGFGVAQAASCYAKSCDGKGPVTYGCSDGATTPVSQMVKFNDAVTAGYVDIRYSAECKTQWTRSRATYNNAMEYDGKRACTRTWPPREGADWRYCRDNLLTRRINGAEEGTIPAHHGSYSQWTAMLYHYETELVHDGIIQRCGWPGGNYGDPDCISTRFYEKY